MNLLKFAREGRSLRPIIYQGGSLNTAMPVGFHYLVKSDDPTYVSSVQEFGPIKYVGGVRWSVYYMLPSLVPSTVDLCFAVFRIGAISGCTRLRVEACGGSAGPFNYNNLNPLSTQSMGADRYYSTGGGTGGGVQTTGRLRNIAIGGFRFYIDGPSGALCDSARLETAILVNNS